jgi:hypothetical protein
MRWPLLLAAVLLAGCGGAAKSGWSGDGAVRWQKQPYVYAPAHAVRDRAVMGQIRNASKAALRLDARRVVVRDGAGHVLVSSVRFAGSWGHPLYGAFQHPAYADPTELFRLGVVSYVQPGGRAPLFVSYRMRAGSRPPIVARVAGTTLPLPTSG